MSVRRRGSGESGQILPWAAAGLLAAALVALLVARTAAERAGRMRARTAADAAALSAATAYARGLNVAAASNQLLLAAAITDLALKATGAGLVKDAAAKAAKALTGAGGVPTSLTETVTKLQDLWAGTWVRVPPGRTAPSPAGFAPLMMAATAVAVGEANGLHVVPLWNGARGPGAAVPDLNLRRATATDVARALRGSRSGKGKGPGDEEEERYSYRPGGTGERVEVPPSEVERIRYRDASGRWVERARMRDGAGNLAGRFLRVDRVATKVLKALDFPLPLVERGRMHRVAVFGRRRDGVSAAVVVSAAEVGGGEVFNAAFGDPSYGVRLVEAPGGLAADPEVLRLLASPASLRSWLARSASAMLADYARAAAGRRLASVLPGAGGR